MVTLSADRGAAAQLDHIQQLIYEGVPGEWAVKDSFCRLDLTPFGFRILFEAEWIYRAAVLPKPNDSIPGVRWVKLTEASELAGWEMVWSGEPANKLEARQARIFLPALLADENIAVIAAYQGEQIVAGVIANRTGKVVGLSNLFVPAVEAERFRAGCIAKAGHVFPDLPLVGYESGHDLAEMQTLGFKILGPLRIWVRGAESE